MFNDISNNSTEAEDKYGISVSCRIPAILHKEIGNEAALRGISLARQLTSLLQTGHQQAANSNAEINILIREKESLQKEIHALTQQLETISHKFEVLKIKQLQQQKDEVFLAPLRRNRDLLKKYASAGSVPLANLEREGFDFTFVTQTMMDQDKPIFCILDMSYRIENDKIIISPISQKNLNA